MKPTAPLRNAFRVADTNEFQQICLIFVLTRLCFQRIPGVSTYENRRGREWSRREPSDMDEARRGELSGESESIEPVHETKATLSKKPEHDLEAGAGIEPANSGFADRDLTTWLPRRFAEDVKYRGFATSLSTCGAPCHGVREWWSYGIESLPHSLQYLQ